MLNLLTPPHCACNALHMQRVGRDPMHAYTDRRSTQDFWTQGRVDKVTMRDHVYGWGGKAGVSQNQMATNKRGNVVHASKGTATIQPAWTLMRSRHAPALYNAIAPTPARANCF